METLTKDCVKCVRGKNSYNGNPRYIFTFSDGSEVKTESDSMFVYGLAPCDHYEQKTITFECTFNHIMTNLLWHDSFIKLNKRSCKQWKI